MKRLYTAIFLFPLFIGLFTGSANAQTSGFPKPLPNRTMISFSGHTKQNKIELKGTLSASHSYDKMIIERGDVPGVFVTIDEINVSGTASSEFNFNFIHRCKCKWNFLKKKILFNIILQIQIQIQIQIFHVRFLIVT